MSDLIIEGAKGLPDGLYVIKDGELFKYKAKGGTVRSYHVTDRPKGRCKTCKRSSDYRWSIGENDTRCPIEEHYALPKDGYCHLYEQI